MVHVQQKKKKQKKKKKKQVARGSPTLFRTFPAQDQPPAYRDSVISSGSASPPIISCCLQLASRKTQGEFTIDKCGITVDRCVPPVERKACAWRTPVDWVCKKRKDHVFLIVPSNPVHHQTGPRANAQTSYSKKRAHLNRQ